MLLDDALVVFGVGMSCLGFCGLAIEQTAILYTAASSMRRMKDSLLHAKATDETSIRGGW